MDDIWADDLVPDAVLDREAAIVVLDEFGMPTGVIDTSALTLDGVDLVPAAEAVTHPLAATAPGAELAALVEVFDTDTSTDSTLIDLIAACERVKSWADARAAAATAELTRRCKRLRGVGPRAEQVPAEVLAAAEIGPALRLSPVAAGMRVWFAGALTARPATRAALETGQIDTAKARTLLRGIDHLDRDTASAVESKILPRAGGQTLARLRSALRRAVIAADPAAAAALHQKAVAERGVWREAAEDGMGRLEWVGPLEQVEATHHWLTSLARAVQQADRASGGPVRTLDQARSDVLADLADGAGPVSAGSPPGAARVDVVVNLSTLLGLDDVPGELPGLGPVTAEVARRIAGDATWRRLLTDPVTGALLDLSSTRYSPPQAMRDAVIARDRTCRFLGCRMPAVRCDLDHTEEWPCGPTCPANLACLCRTHHRIKTLTDTTYRPDGNGGFTWTMPSGRTWHQPPEPMLDPPDPRPPGDTPADDIPPF